MSLRVREQTGIVVSEAEWQRYIKRIRQLDGFSTTWLSAAWAVAGIAATLAIGAVTIRQWGLVLGIAAGLCGVGCFGCFMAHRDVNRKRTSEAEEIALEMEETSGTDYVSPS